MADTLNDVKIDNVKQVDQMIRDNPAMGKCQWKVKASWLRGTHTQVTVAEWSAGGQPMAARPRKFVVMVDEPEMLGGLDNAPNPVEVVMSALCGCVTAGIATNAELFGVPLDAVEIDMEADLDARGMLGHDKAVRNGITDIRYTVTIQSPAPEATVRKCKETIDRKSVVRDTLANPVNITSNFIYKPR
jgi:uncharacterized OsmC-like protein